MNLFNDGNEVVAKCKVILVGDAGVGKTALIDRYVRDTFDGNTMTTIAASTVTKFLEIEGQGKVRLMIWDTAGQEKYHSIVPQYLKSASVIILVFDLTNRSSFDNLNKWIKMIKDNAELYANIYIVGNKADLDDKFELKEEDEITKYCESVHARAYKSCSALNGQNVTELFSDLLESATFWPDSILLDNAEPKEGCC